MFLSKYENVHVFQSVQCKKGNWKYQKLCKYSHVEEAKEKRQPYESSQCTLYNLLLNYQCSRISVLENCNIREKMYHLSPIQKNVHIQFSLMAARPSIIPN